MNRYPYHRYLRWLALQGESVSEIVDHIADLGFVAPTHADARMIISTVVGKRAVDENGVVRDQEWREECDVELFDSDDEDISDLRDIVFWIVETAPVRALVEKLLIDGMTCRQVATVLKLRVNASQVNEKVVAAFRDGFWDVKTLTSIDFRNYYALAGIRRPRPKDYVPLDQVAAAKAWDAGLLPDVDQLTTDDIVRSIQVGSYLRYAKATTEGYRGEITMQEARSWAGMALKASAMERGKKVEKKQADLPKMKTRIHYPTTPMMNLEDLHAMEQNGKVPDSYLSPVDESEDLENQEEDGQ